MIWVRHEIPMIKALIHMGDDYMYRVYGLWFIVFGL